MLNRQRLFWTIATRQQLARWEPLAASNLLRQNTGGLNGAEIWQAEMEHHFPLIAARNLVKALELTPASAVPIEPTLRAELIEGRDLLEHWAETMPLFNVTPRPGQPVTGERTLLRGTHAAGPTGGWVEQQDRRSADARRFHSTPARPSRCGRERRAGRP